MSFVAVHSYSGLVHGKIVTILCLSQLTTCSTPLTMFGRLIGAFLGICGNVPALCIMLLHCSKGNKCRTRWCGVEISCTWMWHSYVNMSHCSSVAGATAAKSGGVVGRSQQHRLSFMHFAVALQEGQQVQSQVVWQADQLRRHVT